MRKVLLFLICIFCFWKGQCFAQIMMSNMKISLPEQYDTLFTNRLGTCCSPEKDCPAYRYITLVEYGFRHKDGQCELFLYDSPIGMARTVKRHEDIYAGSHTLFNRIKESIGWGNSEQWKPTDQEKIDMDMLLTWLPKKQAKKLFNADCAAVLPMNFKGKRCRDKFTWGRGVVFLSGSGLCYLYFIFTDNARPFEEYLKEIKGAFWLEKCKIKKEPML